MKKTLLVMLTIVMLLAVAPVAGLLAEENISLVKQFPDQNLRNEVCLILGKNETDTITPKEALEVRTLSLAGRSIKNLEGIDIFKNLLLLDVSDNQIQDIPEEIKELKNLRILAVEGNSLKELGKGILSLSSLEVLTAGNNQLSSLPEDLNTLENLEQLQLQKNSIASLPAGISSLRNLEMLVLESNLLSSLPKEIGNLDKLTILDLSHNRIEEIPWEVANLHKLYFLDLSVNRIHKMDMHLFNEIKNVKAVYLYNQSYREIMPNSGIVFQDFKVRSFEICALDLGFDLMKVLIGPDGAEKKLETAIHGGFMTIPGELLDKEGTYLIKTTIKGGEKHSFGDDDQQASVYEQEFSVKEAAALPENDRSIYLNLSIIVFVAGLILVVGTRFIKTGGGF